MKPSHEKIWKRNAKQVIKAVPALGDRKSALAQQMLDLLHQEPAFGWIEDGFWQAFIELRHRNVEYRSTRSKKNQRKACIT